MDLFENLGKDFNKSNSQKAADGYNNMLLKWQKTWQKVGKELRAEHAKENRTPNVATLTEHVNYFLSDEFDETFFQIVLCEASKIVNFIYSEPVIYTRGYWKEPDDRAQAQQQHLEEEDEEEKEEDEEELEDGEIDV